MSRHIALIILFAITVCSGGCSTPMSGQTKGSGNTQLAESAGAIFAGPQYTIEIVKFNNMVPTKVSGAGEAAATILRTQLEAAGLNTILLDTNAVKEEDQTIALSSTSPAKTGGKHLESSFDHADFRLSGAITAYSEVEEGIDANAFQKRSVVARTSVDYALTDVVTGKPLLSESGTGTYRKDLTGTPAMGAKSMYDPNVRDNVLRDALAKAVDKVVQKLNTLPFQGRLLSVDGPIVMLRAGSRSQLKDGAQLIVFHVGDALHDPISGQILGYKETRVGVIRINRNSDENTSEASIVSGSGFQAGDIARYNP
ncbi:MAG: hypothetical protein WBQ69_06395 [Gallionella sp.]